VCSSDLFEIIVVDNGSWDATRVETDAIAALNKHHTIRYVFEPEPGLLSGRHRGASEARGEILVFVDDDIEAEPFWLSSIVQAFSREDVHLAGGPSLPRFEVQPPAWTEMYWIKTDGEVYCGTFSAIYLGDTIHEIDPKYVWGLNFAIRKKTLIELGGFHPDCIPKHLQMFQGDGETGLSIKAKERGLKALYVPGAKVFHNIPRERLTVNAFESRHFYQGVCDSFTAIRRNNGIENIRLPNGPADPGLDQTQSIYWNYERIISWRVSKSYVDGFLFHFNAARNNSDILQWVLRQDYFDYRLPKLKDILNSCYLGEANGRK
jgi:glycosyltransferase involved in cell wall biosynthesis